MLEKILPVFVTTLVSLELVASIALIPANVGGFNVTDSASLGDGNKWVDELIEAAKKYIELNK